MKPLVGILDISLGNHKCVTQSCLNAGANIIVSNNTTVLDQCSLLVLPGVGSFPEGALRLRESGLDSYLLQAHEQSRKILGICLGMHLLSEYSVEFKYTKGLGLIQGGVHKLTPANMHIGWNEVAYSRSCFFGTASRQPTLFFNHSYALIESSHAYAYTYCPNKIVSIVKNSNTYGFQFHPEKSQSMGIEILKFIIHYNN